MTFGYPDLLWLLLALPVGGIVVFFAVRRSLRNVLVISGDFQRRDITNLYVVRYFVASVLFAGAVASVIIAAAEPEWGEQTVEDDRQGLEIVFLIDVSNSMRAEDVEPSRLARARSVARAVVTRFPEAYTGVVIFKGAATTLVPMTEDSVAFDLAMSNLSGGLITTAGTSLYDGLATALDAFPPGSPRHQVIILFSDGEELQRSVDTLSDRLRRSDIPVLAVQTGTSAGATIPLSSGGVLRDGSGNPVVVGVDEAVLRKLADISKGRYFQINDPTVTQSIVEELQRRIGDGKDLLFRRAGEDRYHLFVLLAFVLLTAKVVSYSIPWGRKKGIE
ncbi:MAG: VWA domain-containing protein [Alkalispirochaeta sp.]